MRVKSIAVPGVGQYLEKYLEKYREKYREKPLAGNLRRDLLSGLLMTGMALLLWGCSGAAPKTTLVEARIQRVVSGHTLEVTIPSADPARIQRVRLIGIDAPNIEQKPWGANAQQFLQQQLDRQVPEGSTDKPSVQLEVDLQQQDEYQRVLAYVWLDNQLLNQVMVAQGYALASSRLPNVRYEERIKRAQESARLSGLGLWDPQNPMRQTPVEFRGTL